MQQNQNTVPINSTNMMFLSNVQQLPLNNSKISNLLYSKDNNLLFKNAVQQQILNQESTSTVPLEYQQQALPYSLLIKNGGDVLALTTNSSMNKAPVLPQQPQRSSIENVMEQQQTSPVNYPSEASSSASGFNIEISRKNSFGNIFDILDRTDPLYEDFFSNSIQSSQNNSTNTYQNKDLWFETPLPSTVPQPSSSSDVFFDSDDISASTVPSLYSVPALVTSGAWVVDPNQQQGLVQPTLQTPLPLQNSSLVDTNQLNAIIQELLLLRNATQTQPATMPNVITNNNIQAQQPVDAAAVTSNEKQKKKRGRVPKSEDTVLKTMPAPQLNIQIAPISSLPETSSTSNSIMFSLVQTGEDGIERLGRYSLAERADKIRQYRAQRGTRVFTKKIRYECRKNLADNRPRYKGRFCKTMPTEEEIRKEQEEKEKRLQEKRAAKKAKKN